MKKLLILSAMLLFAAGTGFAQNYIVVDSEKIFKSIDEYNKAVEEIDALAVQYQKNIDDAYAKIEEQYNSYMEQKASLSEAVQKQREETIINNEKRVTEYQESIFGSEGTLTKAQKEKLEPIQKKVREQIAVYARANNHGLVIDITTNPTVLFYDPSVDKTEQIIAVLKK